MSERSGKVGIIGGLTLTMINMIKGNKVGRGDQLDQSRLNP